jgi:hypothetical protein
MPDLDCCFELFGFDVMVDSACKPWLLEVNSSPAMDMDYNVDFEIKPNLIKDCLKLMHFEPFEEYNERIKVSKQRSNHSNFF